MFMGLRTKLFGLTIFSRNEVSFVVAFFALCCVFLGAWDHVQNCYVGECAWDPISTHEFEVPRPPASQIIASPPSMLPSTTSQNEY